MFTSKISGKILYRSFKDTLSIKNILLLSYAACNLFNNDSYWIYSGEKSTQILIKQV